jgi:ankyrin repeat protein
LANGRTVELAGLDLEQMDARQRAEFEAALSKLVLGENKAQLLALDEHPPLATVVSPRYAIFWREFPVVILFPVHVKVPPMRVDIGLQLVWQGLARVRESEVPSQRLTEYLVAEREAKQRHVGIWKTGAEQLCDAAGEGDLEKMKSLIDAGVSSNSVGYTLGARTTPLISAAVAGHAEVVKYLLTKGADLKARNTNHISVLGLAASNGHAQVVSLLIEAGADLEDGGLSERPLACAVSNGHVEAARLLLEAGAAPDGHSGDNVPLLNAVTYGRTELVTLLVEHKASVNLRDRDGRTPLIMASWNGSPKIVKYLLAHGAEVNARDRFGYTALKAARQRHHVSLADVLVAAGGRE